MNKNSNVVVGYKGGFQGYIFAPYIPIMSSDNKGILTPFGKKLQKERLRKEKLRKERKAKLEKLNIHD